MSENNIRNEEIKNGQEQNLQDEQLENVAGGAFFSKGSLDEKAEKVYVGGGKSWGEYEWNQQVAELRRQGYTEQQIQNMLPYPADLPTYG